MDTMYVAGLLMMQMTIKIIIIVNPTGIYI